MIYTNTYAPKAASPWAAAGVTISGGDIPVTVDLNRRMPGIDFDAPPRSPRANARMRGVYTLEWDLSGFELPPVTDASGWYLRVHIYVAGDLRDSTRRPCDDQTLRLWLVGVPPLITLSGEGSTHELTVSEEILVASIRGEVRCYSETSNFFDYAQDPEQVLLWRESRYGYELV